MEFTGKRILIFFLALLLFSDGSSSVSATTQPAKIVNGLISNAAIRLMKWVWSLKTNTKIAISGRPMMKFESGYMVETVFDGSKLGIEPYSVKVLPSEELLILDSVNSNLYRISSSLSQYTRPKLVAGSPEGYSGHVDGKLREAKMNHPKGIAVDDKGNIYVADTTNMVIRKITDSGVTTIAGGKRTRGEHVDGPSEEAKFSNDFDVVYVGSSCSLLVIDRGNRAIREIQLHFDDCAYQYESGLPLDLAVLLAAGFFGYMLALLQRRVWSLVSSQNELTTETSMQTSLYQKPPRSMRPPLIPSENETENQEEESFLISLKKLSATALSSATEVLGSLFPSLKKQQPSINYQIQHPFQYHPQQPNPSMSQESFEVPKEDQPPSIEPRTPTPKKTYAFMSKDTDIMQHQLRQSRLLYTTLEEQKHQNQHQQNLSVPQTYYEQSHETNKEIVFGAIQEIEGQVSPVVKPTKYADSSYDLLNVRYRMGYRRDY
ncbi:hypothetical protein V2J09_020018 [Rumex salicifolius]